MKRSKIIIGTIIILVISTVFLVFVAKNTLTSLFVLSATCFAESCFLIIVRKKATIVNLILCLGTIIINALAFYLVQIDDYGSTTIWAGVFAILASLVNYGLAHFYSRDRTKPKKDISK